MEEAQQGIDVLVADRVEEETRRGEEHEEILAAGRGAVKAFAGDAAQNWLLLKDGDHVIGLFQWMFEENILTFNPGWDQNATAPARPSHSIESSSCPAAARRGHVALIQNQRASASSSDFDDASVHAMQPSGRTSIDAPSFVRAWCTLCGSDRSEGEMKRPPPLSISV